MFRRFAKLSLIAVLLTLPLSTLAAPAEESIPVFLVDENGSLVFTDLFFVDNANRAVDAIPKPVPGDACNGGSCTTDIGTVLECPTSGGPECDDDEECICKCIENEDGTWSAANRCVARSDG